MAWNLYKLGRWCFQHRGRVVAGWIVVLLLGAFGAATLAGETSSKFELPDTESSRAFDLIKERTPQAATDGAVARVVIEAPDGQTLTDTDAQADITAALKDVSTKHVASVAEPFTTGTVSEDGTTAYATITYDRVAVDLTSADDNAVEKAVEALESKDYTVLVGGDAFVEAPHGLAAEAVGVAIAFIVLAITFGSLVAAGMPLLTAVVGVGIGIMGVSTVSGFVELSSVTPALASMLGLAVGIDYALFIMSRYQHEVRAGRERQEAAAISVGTAGSAVVFAGLTVVIALAGLSLTGISFLTQMGLAGAATVAVAVLIALTLLPALLSVTGRKVAIGRDVSAKRHAPEGTTGRTVGRRWVDFITRFRGPVLVLGLVAAAVLSYPITKMELALPDDGSKPSSSQQRQAYDAISEKFGAGSNGPLTVVVDTKGSDDPAAAADAALAKVSAVKTDVAAVVPPLADPSNEEAAQQYQQQLETVGFAAITVIPQSGPSDSETKDLVQSLRDNLKDLPEEAGATAYVTGQTAAGVDLADTLTEAFPTYLLVVVGLAFLLLVLVFRSIWVPIKAALGFLVSLGISLGATVAVFQWGWLQNLIGLDAEAPVVFILPLILTGILFGLAMDYEVFLVSRMREEFVHGREAREAVVVGFQHSARVVTAAALIMMGVFAGFIFGDDPIIKTLGFSLAVGVAADAFLVRMLIVPAIMSIVGKRMWWIPSWLDRRLPNVDIEGEGLARRLQTEADSGRVVRS